ncbi:MAG: ECF transporter S component [Ruminococcaceae bacterium]|nr:ECF transporter S component [Oscillospiraceae bacterium]
MSNKIDRRSVTQKLVYLSFLAALIVVLQVLASYIKVGAVSICLVLLPIVFGGMLFGLNAGLFLGIVFGLLTFILGLTGFDPGTLAMIQFKPIETFAICVIKGALAGLLSSLAYKGMFKLTKNNVYLSSLVGFIVAPVVNTSIYILGVALFFKDFYQFTQSGFALIVAIFIAIIVNFISEFLLNVICGPLIALAASRNKSVKKILYKQ